MKKKPKEPTWVLASVVVQLNADLVEAHGGAGVSIRDSNALHSACARAQQLFTYQPDASLADMAARYAVGIAKNHPFVDGNKRTALASMIVFLKLNGKEFKATQAQAVAALVMVAEGAMTEDEFASFVAENIANRSKD